MTGISYKLAFMAALPLLKFVAKSTSNQLDDNIIKLVDSAMNGTLTMVDVVRLFEELKKKL